MKKHFFKKLNLIYFFLHFKLTHYLPALDLDRLLANKLKFTQGGHDVTGMSFFYENSTFDSDIYMLLLCLMEGNSKSQLTKEEAYAFRKRWELVNAAEIEELRRTSLSKKMQQLASLMLSVKELDWHKALSEGESELRERWNRLRMAYHVR